MPTATTENIIAHIPDWALAKLSPESAECIQHLLAYQAPSLPDFGIVRQAAVLVALFQRPGDDQLSVLLTTRAKTMRRHPSQTALPGGKVDPEDPSPIFTARREANEEVSLPLDPHPHIHHITTLDPVLTILPLNAHLKNHIVVIPVVCFISDPTLIDRLKPSPDEVDRIFSHPLRDVMSVGWKGRIPKDWWISEGNGGRMIRNFTIVMGHADRCHWRRFRTTHSPIKGLTSDVLINTATIAYGSPPHFERFAPNQTPFSTVIANVVRELPDVLESEKGESLIEKSLREGRVLEWGGTEPGSRYKSGETWHEKA